MDSPRSEKEETRFSTPVSDLDDHRNQSPIPPAHLSFSAQDGTAHGNSGAAMEKVDLLTVAEPLRTNETVTRDFEHAIVDDDRSGTADTAAVAPNADATSPAPRRGFSRRVQQKLEGLDRTRDVSPSSSRSVSPPNSVDAFAEPRRRERANTFGSRGPSELNLQLQRTVSGGSRGRRPTFSSADARQMDLKVDSDRPEEDVCFPQPEEPSKTFKIDYEEMEEFVAEFNRGRPSESPRRKHSFSSRGGPLPGQPRYDIPKIIKHAASPERQDSDSDVKINGNLDEKRQERAPITEPLSTIPETNRFSFFSSELEQTIHAPELGDLVMPDETFRDLFELTSENGAWWLDVMNPTEPELEMFQKAFGIHRLTAEDIERQEIREKVELFKQYYFVCFRSFYQIDKESEDYLEPVNVYMVVFREGILTFTYAASPHAVEVRRRIGKLRNYINLTADWICYAMVDNIVDCFGPVIRSIEIETDQIEDQVFVARQEDFASLLRQIGECRKKVMQLMRLLGGKADVIKGFAKRCNEQYSVAPRGEIGLYLGDIQDHVVTMMSNLGHFEKMLSRCHSNYLAQISVDSIAQGSRANEVLGKITLVATVLVPMNLICGLFGMNVPVPGGVNEGSLSWFFGILGLIASIVLLSLIVARRLRYI